MIVYQDNLIHLHQGHILDVLPKMPAESVHCVVTSPPYWGLRDYGLEPQVWDEDHPILGTMIKCEHEWGDNLQPRGQSGWHTFERKHHNPGSHKTTLGLPMKQIELNKGHGQFCQKCNAWKGSLGLEPTPDLYVQHIVEVFKEIWRVIRPDCTVWVNIGDSYASGKGSCFNPRGGKNSLGIPRKEAGVHPLSRGNVSDLRKSGLKPKDLCMIPARVALALQADGWWLRRDIIWNKSNPMPESCTDRPTTSHEFVFLLTKSGTPQFWTHRELSGTRTRPKADWRWVSQVSDEEVDTAPDDWKEIIVCPECKGKGIVMADCSCEIMGEWMERWVEDECPICEGEKKVQKWKRINLWRGHDYFYDADAVREKYTGPINRWGGQKQGSDTRKGRYYRDQMQNVGSTSALRPGADLRPNPAGRSLRSVWTIPTQSFPQAHFATFPEKLASICIKAGTSEKGCCPECGAPWVRVVEKSYRNDTTTNGRPAKGNTRPELRENAGDVKVFASGERTRLISKTIGWKPSCDCGYTKYQLRTCYSMHECVVCRKTIRDGQQYYDGGIKYRVHKECAALNPIPCTVLDPFAGSCRALIVAKKLGRKGIGIDLKGEYLDMPKKELRQEMLEF